jgi:hypothetical protein
LWSQQSAHTGVTYLEILGFAAPKYCGTTALVLTDHSFFRNAINL